MSLAMFAAPFEENMNNESDNFINKKRQTHNKTQKRYYPKENFETNQSFNKEKVNSVLEKIHNNSGSDDEDEKNNLGDFNPPPMPQSAGVNKTIATEQMSNMSNKNNETMFKALGRAPQPNYEQDSGLNLDLNDYNNYGDSKSVEEYYKKILPGYTGQNNMNNNHYNKPYYNVNYNQSVTEVPSQDILLQKLNYMINLLEEQKDEKTSNVTEEVVLYSFLGIFIIFVVDSFARVGKYVR